MSCCPPQTKSLHCRAHRRCYRLLQRYCQQGRLCTTRYQSRTSCRQGMACSLRCRPARRCRLRRPGSCRRRPRCLQRNWWCMGWWLAAGLCLVVARLQVSRRLSDCAVVNTSLQSREGKAESDERAPQVPLISGWCGEHRRQGRSRVRTSQSRQWRLSGGHPCKSHSLLSRFQAFKCKHTDLQYALGAHPEQRRLFCYCFRDLFRFYDVWRRRLCAVKRCAGHTFLALR
jgi:hypothetical protein